MSNRRQEFFVCKHCGNLVGMINDAGVEIICCGEAMTKLEPNTVDASQEKHVPQVTVKGDVVDVQVGSTLHPMVAEHYIEWIYLETKRGGQRKNLSIDGQPAASFAVVDDTPLAVYAYCNLHGLWKTELN